MSTMEIDEQMKQWLNIKFLVQLGKNSQEIHEMLRVIYGNNLFMKHGWKNVEKANQSHAARFFSYIHDVVHN